MDYDIDDAIHNRKRNYKLFLKIVGENPLDQIDWIVENGLDKFNYWYRCYETGKIYSPATVEQEHSHGVRGGLGNRLYRFKSKSDNQWTTIDTWGDAVSRIESDDFINKINSLEDKLKNLTKDFDLLDEMASMLEKEFGKRYK